MRNVRRNLLAIVKAIVKRFLCCSIVYTRKNVDILPVLSISRRECLLDVKG